MYINDLAMVMFTGIKHTADWFLASFKENEVASCEFSFDIGGGLFCLLTCIVCRQVSLIGQSNK
jgi:hypothetical protein